MANHGLKWQFTVQKGPLVVVGGERELYESIVGSVKGKSLNKASLTGARLHPRESRWGCDFV